MEERRHFAQLIGRPRLPLLVFALFASALLAVRVALEAVANETEDEVVAAALQRRL